MINSDNDDVFYSQAGRWQSLTMIVLYGFLTYEFVCKLIVLNTYIALSVSRKHGCHVSATLT